MTPELWRKMASRALQLLFAIWLIGLSAFFLLRFSFELLGAR